MAHKDIDRLDLPDGYTLAVSGTQHLTVIQPDGEPLRMPNGVPVTCALTPGTDRTRTIEAARIRRALRGEAEAPARGVEAEPEAVPEPKRDKPPRSASRRKEKARLGGKVRFVESPRAPAPSCPATAQAKHGALDQVEKRYRAEMRRANMTSFEREVYEVWRFMRSAARRSPGRSLG